MTRTEFAEAIAALESGVNVALSEQTAAVWYAVLGDLPPDSLKRAVVRYLAECEYPGLPPVGKLRRLATEDLTGLALTAGDAWAAVMDAVRHYGYYDAAAGVQSLDALTQRALRAVGGFTTVCNSREDDSIMVAQFRKAYDAMASREQTMARLPENARPRIGSKPATLTEHPTRRIVEDVANCLASPPDATQEQLATMAATVSTSNDGNAVAGRTSDRKRSR